MKKIFAIVSSILCSVVAVAQVQIGEPAYGGNGCPKGSAAIVMTEDGRTMSVLFDKYIAEAGFTTGKRIDRASCNLRIPIHVPAGYSVTLMKVDYRGFNAVPSGGSTTFNAEYFYAGSKGGKHQKKTHGPKNDEFTTTDDVVAVSWSPCGKDMIFGVNTSAVAVANSRMDQTMIIIDSADFTQQDLGLIYSFDVRRCE